MHIRFDKNSQKKAAIVNCDITIWVFSDEDEYVEEARNIQMRNLRWPCC